MGGIKMTHKFTFPLPPSANGLTATVGSGRKTRRVNTADYKKWMSIAPKTPPLKIDSCYIEYTLYFPDYRVRDSKNFLKAIDDWLVKCETLTDDSWKVIAHETIAPKLDRDKPRVEVLIIPIGDKDA
jgi:Holliday junction resolvase RusA-like endonuclease